MLELSTGTAQTWLIPSRNDRSNWLVKHGVEQFLPFCGPFAPAIVLQRERSLFVDLGCRSMRTIIRLEYGLRHEACIKLGGSLRFARKFAVATKSSRRFRQRAQCRGQDHAAAGHCFHERNARCLGKRAGIGKDIDPAHLLCKAGLADGVIRP